MITAYMRISTAKESQKHDRQEKAISDYASANGFEINMWVKDTVSGKTAAETRPNYQHMKGQLPSGSILIVSDLDRLGRDATDTIAEIKNLQQRGVRLIALDVPYLSDFEKVKDDSMHRMITDILITLKAHLAEQERIKTVSRINQGLAVARDKGVRFGRPPTQELPADFIKKYEQFIGGCFGKMTASGFAKMIGISRSSFYKYVGIYNAGKTVKLGVR